MAKAPSNKAPAAAKARDMSPGERKKLVALYRRMLLIRRFEEKAGQLYGMGHIGGFCHLYIGQEAVVVGVLSALSGADTIITSYRDHGHMLASGIAPEAVMAELTGRASGVSAGKGGSMHMFAPEQGFFGGHGIVGAQVPIGTGLALAHKYQANKAVSVTFFGDGAANQGQVYEAFNMAELWRLPVLYIIENNQYAMGTSVRRSSAQTRLFKRGDSFRIPGEEVDGMDVLAVREAAKKGLAWCRAGKGPRILEMKTYRYRGHSMSDPAKYRSREEVQKMKAEHDPIDHLRERLTKGGMKAEAIKKIDAEIKATVGDAADHALAAPEPAPATLFDDIYAPAAG